MQPSPVTPNETRNLLLAIVLATLVMGSWHYFVEAPRQAIARAEYAEKQQALAAAAAREKAAVVEATKEQSAEGPRITIRTPRLHGSLALTGARFDQLTLADYRQSLAEDAPEVVLLSPAGEEDAYFIELGMLPDEDGVNVPNARTVWQADGRELTPETPVTLRWNNGAGLVFEKKIAVDENAMFTVTTLVRNQGAAPVTLYPYGLISRNHDGENAAQFLHEGPMAVVNNVLEDVAYTDVQEGDPKRFTQAKGWVGMSDKYWLTAIVPAADMPMDISVKRFTRGAYTAYQADLRAPALEVPVGKSASAEFRIFAGAKELSTLDKYAKAYTIPLFDRAVDFGTLYFIARPFFELLSLFHGMVGNFGLAILLLTVCIKAVLFPLANKSMISMARMKQLMPKMTEIRERHADDKMRMNQEIMALYKREGVNPVGGCLPMLLQLPVFFALYRVLYVTIEMRHAPFFGWVQDLSAVDPSNLFTLFGVIDWTPPGFLHLGIWPILMCATMVIQQRLSPKPADEVQAMVMQWMPYLFLFLFATFPAGLVIYWTWSNVLTICQQAYINRQLDKKGLR